MTSEIAALNPHLAAITVSPILQLEAAAAARRKAGFDVISLSIGELDADTPRHIRAAARAALRAGATRYTPLTGTLELKQAIARHLEPRHERSYRPDEIIVSAGAKQSIFNALFATMQPGDEVILPCPYWTSYPDIVRACGGRPVLAPTRAANGYKLRPADLQNVLTPRSRWLILNSPANPTGAVYDPAEISALLQVVDAQPRLLLLADEIYDGFVFDNAVLGRPAALTTRRDRVVTVGGVSKAYAMTGWRIGYAAGPAWLIAAMATMQSQSTSCACAISQAAAAAALSGPQACVERFRNRLMRRRRLVLNALRNIPDLSCQPPQAAFYAFLSWRGTQTSWSSKDDSRDADGHDIDNRIANGGDADGGDADGGGADGSDADAREAGGREAGGRVSGFNESSDVAFCRYLLEEHGLALVPGSAFGMPGHVRLSYAVSRPMLQEGMRRLAIGCRKWQARSK